MIVDGSQLVAVILAVTGAMVAAWAAPSRPAIAIGTLFLLASLSRLVVETPVGAMRIEQPAIALVAVVLLARGRLAALRRVSPMEIQLAVALAAYVVVLTLSSALLAEQPIESLRMVAWLVISMIGGGLVYVLARAVPEATVLPIAIGGAAKAAVGLVMAALFLVFGPTADWGVQEAFGFLPRVHAFTWEANLYASFLAIAIPFAIEATRGPSRRVGVALLVLVVIGLPLGATRGAYLGAVGGVAAYGIARLFLERRPVDLARLGALIAASAVIGLLATDFLLPNAVERYVAETPVPNATPGPVASDGMPGTGVPVETADPAPTRGPAPSIRPYPDTISFRLDRVPIALADLSTSPLIGLGADSFGQRHLDPSQAGEVPDHLAILAVAVIHDAGIVGAVALGLAFLLLLKGAWLSARAAARRRDSGRTGLAAAGIGAMVAMLVAYQATNAMHFGSSWMIVGAATAIAFARHDPS